MKGARNKTLKKRLAERIRRKKADIFLRKDFADMGDYDQVGRDLRQLVAKGRLVKIGYDGTDVNYERVP